jgi:energy-coupling factor transport system ATP-binding protein
MSVRLDAVTFRYPSCHEPALRSVSFTAGPGKVVLVTGRVGSGASTLLLTIAGLAPRVTGGVVEGRVQVLQQDPASAEGRRLLAGRVAVLLSTPWTQLSGMAFTAGDEVAFAPANLGWPRERIRDAVDRTLELVGARHLAGRDPRTLSGGELQRVMLAAVLVTDPEVLLLDEPTMELDPENAAAIYRLIPELAQQATVLIASTDVDRAVEIADRVLLLQAGELVGDGSPDEVLADDARVSGGVSTTAAEIARIAGCTAPYPLTVPRAAKRFAP